MTNSPDPTPVVLGMHADDTLNIFVRNEDGALHQAARIVTVNGVDPSAMTAVMADLADTFGWRQIAAAADEVPHPSRELLRDTGVAAAAPVTVEPLALPRTPAAPAAPARADFRRMPRRKHAEMQLQKATIARLLKEVPADKSVPTAAVSAQVSRLLGIKLGKTEGTVRAQLKQLHHAGLIGRRMTLGPNGYEVYTWYGL